MTTIINSNILFALDTVVLIALAVAMLYVYRLNKQLKHFNESREELKVFLSSFGESLKHTKMGIREIKAIGDSIAIEIGKKLNQAKNTKDELSFFIDRANKSIEDLEAKIAVTKDMNQKPNFTKSSNPDDIVNSHESTKGNDDKIDQNIINRIKKMNDDENDNENQKEQSGIDIEKNITSTNADEFSKDAILQKLQNIR